MAVPGRQAARTAAARRCWALHSGRFLNPPEPEERHAAGRSTRTVAQLDYQGDRNLVKLFVSGGDSRFDLPSTLAEDQEGRDARRKLQSVTGILSWSHIVSSRALLTGSLYARNVSDDLLPTLDAHTTFADGSRPEWTEYTVVPQSTFHTSVIRF